MTYSQSELRKSQDEPLWTISSLDNMHQDWPYCMK